MNYKHTQIGYLILFVLLAVIILFGSILVQAEFNSIILITMILIVIIVASFASLTVMIDKKYLTIKFGYGIYKKRFLLKDISSARMVKNQWYYGWGIRVWLWPRMIIYNISGFDAVEISMKDKKIYRIGTDEPQRLEQEILQSI
ncbi:hypothetical protein HOL21_01575 [Candidatus Woesearchaeota archaeon]|jgi:hypothetical protein|nr:hypothetical protein [Candidatus Woesearchaeota archaeon]MBT5396882.1 hypothetical protein [Candidatus Woesearchaeota archaeon]MBT6367075.1 hypothetical protein [Candidatus Woesearchaeota archaeon]MBT7762351.1 hypothetical protein [Candidatus Woesearchaeota archaeon]